MMANNSNTNNTSSISSDISFTDVANTSSSSAEESVTMDKVQKLTQNFGKLKVDQNISKVATRKLIAIANEMPGSKIELPTTAYKVEKSLPMIFNYYFYIQCKSCKTYSKTNNNMVICVQCESLGQFKMLNRFKAEYFIYIPLQQQLKQIVARNFKEIMEYQDNNEIYDTKKSEILHEIQRLNPESILLSLTINSDGVEIENSSSKSVWPILGVCNFLPPNIRYNKENILLLALHRAKKKPNMNDFSFR